MNFSITTDSEGRIASIMPILMRSTPPYPGFEEPWKTIELENPERALVMREQTERALQNKDRWTGDPGDDFYVGRKPRWTGDPGDDFHA